MTKTVKNWMKKAFKNAGKGLFHHQLGVPVHEKIPMTLLRKIVKTPINGFVKNPTGVGNEWIKVTRLMKRRAIPLLNADVANK